MKTDHVPGRGRRAPAQGALRGAEPQDRVPELHTGPLPGPLGARGLCQAECRAAWAPGSPRLRFC